MNEVDYLVSKLEDTHPDLYRNYSKDKFCKEAERIKDSNYTDKKYKVALAKLLANLKDGHTTISFYTEVIFDLSFIDSKIYIIDDYKNNNSKYKYKYITKINDVDISEVIKKVLEVIPNETDSWRNYVLCKQLLSKELLIGFGIVKDDFLITLSDGSIVNYNNEIKKDNIKDYQYYENKMINYNTYYVKYATCNEIGNIVLKDWFNDILKTIRKHEISNIIIDLRNNSGGNSSYFSEFFNSLKKEFGDKKYVCLINGGVFSSGCFALNDMINLNATVIGNGPGSYMNHFGFTEVFRLPKSNILVSCSNSEWELKEGKYKRYKKGDVISDETKKRKVFEIDYKIDESIDDYINNDDLYIKKAIEQFN